MKGLIGIEWEPQFALGNYPNRAVYVKGLEGNETESRATVGQESPSGRGSRLDVVYLYLPSSYFEDDPHIGVDPTFNLEVRTAPVPIEGLAGEIKRVYLILQRAVMRIAADHGPTGLYLPQTIAEDSNPNKHINLSARMGEGPSVPLELGRYQGNPYKSVGNVKESTESTVPKRLHVTAPYNFGGSAMYDLFNTFLFAYQKEWASRRRSSSEVMGAITGFIDRWAHEHPMTKPILLGTSLAGTMFQKKRELF